MFWDSCLYPGKCLGCRRVAVAGLFFHCGHVSHDSVQAPVAEGKPAVDYLNLPPPVKYEELQREAMSTPFALPHLLRVLSKVLHGL
jgi:hypothetical protein